MLPKPGYQGIISYDHLPIVWMMICMRWLKGYARRRRSAGSTVTGCGPSPVVYLLRPLKIHESLKR
jgi:hypothetical protein